MTVVVPVWDDYAELVRRCLLAVEQESVRAAVVVVDNASENAVEVPPTARRVTLTTRATVGAARNAGLVAVDTPYVVFADADDEIAPTFPAFFCPPIHCCDRGIFLDFRKHLKD